MLGEAFITENFSRPAMAPVPGPDGQPVMGPKINPMTGQPQMEIDPERLLQTLTKVLEDTSLGKYDIAVGESAR